VVVHARHSKLFASHSCMPITRGYVKECIVHIALKHGTKAPNAWKVLTMLPTSIELLSLKNKKLRLYSGFSSYAERSVSY